MNKFNVVVLLGGESAERSVSLQSGAAVAEALRELGHDVQQVDGLSGFKALQANHKISSDDVVFNILHGADGEDGQLAAWLDLEGFDSTCVSHSAASLSWHKGHAKTLVAAAGVNTPRSQILKSAGELTITGSGPWIVKPATEGSSVGLFKADDELALQAAVNDAFNVAGEILVEDFIQGIECTVGLVGNQVLPVVSIVPAEGLYDYQAKYESSNTQYHCPANFDQKWQQQLQVDAKKACEALGINGWCRVDFIVDENGRAWFLEVNTTPGMTQSSLLPKAAAAQGWDFKQLVAEILSTVSLKKVQCQSGDADE